MASSPLAPVMHLLRQLAERDADGDITDVQLLRRFTKFADEAAFTTLLQRHGPMVCGICRRLLGNESDADDVFQATFLVLIRRARSIRRHTSLGSWLHGVALRLALRVRSDTARRRHHETSRRLESTSTSTARDSDIRPIIDEELGRLNEKYRAPLVLCYLEGKTNDEAARQLGVPPGTVCGRLARARSMLRLRLTRRGLAPALTATALGLGSRPLLANVPPALAGATARLATLLAAAETMTGVSASVTGLVDGMMKTLFVGKMKLAALVLLAAGAVGTGAGVLARQALVKPEEERPAEHALEFQDRPTANPARVDLYGDPLPAEAAARLGTVRFRHGNLIHYVRYTPDGKKIVVHAYDGVRIWEAATGKELNSLPYDTAVFGASLSSDGKLLATASESGLFIWDVSSAALVRSQTDGRYTSVNFSPDDKNLLVTRVDDANELRVEVLDATTFRQLWSVVGVYRGVSLSECVTYAGDGKLVIVSHYASRGDKERTLLVLEAQTGREIRKTELGNKSPFKMAVSPDGNLLAMLCRNWTGEGYSYDMEHYVRVLELASGNEKYTLHAPIEEDQTRQNVYTTAVFTSDSKSLITPGGSDAVVVWDATTGKEQRRLGRNVANSRDMTVCSRDMTVSPDGKTLALAGPNDIRVINLTDGADVIAPDNNRWGLNHAILTKDGKTAITGNNQLIVFWDAVTGKELRRQELKSRSPVDQLCGITSDGAFAYRTNHVDKVFRIRDLSTGQEGEAIKLESEARYAAWLTCVSPDNKVVALTSQLQTRIQLRDSRNGGLLKELTDAGMQVRGLHFTADGRTLVACCADLTIRVWDVASGNKLRQIGPVRQLGAQEDARFLSGGGIHYTSGLSPDGKTIATGSKERCLVFYDVTTGDEVRRGEPLPTDIEEFVFSPDGRLVACNESGNPVINLFEVETAKVRHSLRGHRGKCNVLRFSADGKRLISGSNDTTAVIWDLTGQLGASAELGKPPSVADLDGYWADLAGDDAAKAYQVIRRLAASSDSAVPYLAKQLPPAPSVDAAKVTGFIGDLDSDKFEVRERAFAEFRKIGDAAYGPLERTKTENASEETRRRVELLIDAIKKQRTNPTGDLLRGLRAIETLEFAGTPAAQTALERLATGAPSAKQTQDAKESLVRLRKRS